MKIFSSKLAILLLSFGLLPLPNLNAQEVPKWEMIFNGSDLNSFRQLNGDASFIIENGTLVGVSKLNTANSFLGN